MAYSHWDRSGKGDTVAGNPMPRATARLSKISRPQVADLVPRERLHALLDKGAEASIVWVSGPPGAGKTTLLAHYLESTARDFLWYQMDAGDADVATCFYYLSQATRTRERDANLPAFTLQYLADLPAFARRYFRALFAGLAAPFVVVFDNYHEVPAQSRLHEVVEQGLEEIPPGGCVMLVSRSEPPPFLARFLANSRMQVLGWEDLRLTREESDAIVQLRGHRLRADGKAQLYRRTQGWAAGLVLMLEAIRRESALLEVPEHFTPQVVFDYLAGEIFRRFDEANQTFLLRTATLPQMTAAMATTLTGQASAGETLAYLARHDYLISASHGGEEVSYQYHPLLRDFLRTRAARDLDKQELRRLQARAATLLEQAGHIEDALRLRIENREWAELAAAVCEHAAAMLEQGRGETLERWLEELPGEQIENDAWLTYWLAASKSNYSLREARRLYERAYRMFAAGGEAHVPGMFAACAGVLDTVLFELDDLTLLDAWIEEVERLLERHPGFPSAAWGERVTCNMYLALAFRQPAHPDINAWAERTYAVVNGTADASLKVRSAINLVSGIAWTGRFARALEIVEAVRSLARGPDVSPVVLTTLRYIETMYYMLSGEHEECMRALADGVGIAEATGVHIWTNSILINGVGSALGAGQLERARELLGQLDQQAMATRRFDSCLHHYCRAWLAMLEGRVLDAYQDQRAAVRLAAEVGMPFFEVLFQLGLAQILFACGDERRGAALLQQIRRKAEPIDNQLLAFSSFLVYAQIALTHGRKASGLRALRYALGVGREHNFTHTVWWQPRAMAELACTALEHGIEPEYVRQLVVRRKLVPERPPWHVDAWPWPWRLRTFGRFALQRDGEVEQAKPRGRPVELLKLAVAFGGTEVSEALISDLLWPNIDADYAHRSFNTTLHRLRKLLGDERAVSFAAGKLTLAANWFWLDTWAFERVVQDLSAQLGRAGVFVDHRAVSALAERGLALYAGPFLADETAAWAIAPREHWRGRFVRFVQDVAHYLEGAERTEEAVRLVQAALDADAHAEALYRQLMLGYAALGRNAEAVDTYRRCRETLAAALGVEPSPETQRLYARLAGGG